MPRPKGARGREENEIEFSRIVAFSDGVFAIAITLLVLGLDISCVPSPRPDRPDAIRDQWDNFLAFAISFAVIGRFWIVHHRFFGEVKAFDGRLLSLNLLYLGDDRADPLQQQSPGRLRRPDAPPPCSTRSTSRQWSWSGCG